MRYLMFQLVVIIRIIICKTPYSLASAITILLETVLENEGRSTGGKYEGTKSTTNKGKMFAATVLMIKTVKHFPKGCFYA